MPELPEVESLRRSMLDRVVGARIEEVHVARPDVVLDELERPIRDLVVGSLRRHGKLLAIVESGDARTICVHLGMSGRLTIVEPRSPAERHEHVRFSLEAPDGARLDLAFVDPRRFGGISLHPTWSRAIEQRIAAMGPDALSIDPEALADRLAGRDRPIKSALLDQGLVAGLGNIYVDEVLHLAGVRPSRRCRRVSRATLLEVARLVPMVLGGAIGAGGSTLRDYRDASGRPGSAQTLHRVYGRSGRPCLGCGTTLRSRAVGGRSSCFCPSCQH